MCVVIMSGSQPAVPTETEWTGAKLIYRTAEQQHQQQV